MWDPIDTLAILKLQHYQMSQSAIQDKLLRFDFIKSTLDPWVVDFVAPKLFSKTRDRAFRQADTTSGDNLDELENKTYYFRLHNSL